MYGRPQCRHIDQRRTSPGKRDEAHRLSSLQENRAETGVCRLCTDTPPCRRRSAEGCEADSRTQDHGCGLWTGSQKTGGDSTLSEILGRLLMTRRFTLASAALLLALAGVLPLVSMLVKSLLVDGRLSVHAYAGLFGSTRPWVLLGNSVVVACLTTLAALLIGVPLGILFGRTDLPFRRTFTAILTVPLLIPP